MYVPFGMGTMRCVYSCSSFGLVVVGAVVASAATTRSTKPSKIMLMMMLRSWVSSQPKLDMTYTHSLIHPLQFSALTV